MNRTRKVTVVVCSLLLASLLGLYGYRVHEERETFKAQRDALVTGAIKASQATVSDSIEDLHAISVELWTSKFHKDQRVIAYCKGAQAAFEPVVKAAVSVESAKNTKFLRPEVDGRTKAMEEEIAKARPALLEIAAKAADLDP